MSSPHVTIIGGGSVQWSPSLITDIFLTADLGNATITLHDIDAQATDLVLEYGLQVAAALQVPGRVRKEPDLERALAGADYVIIVISTGGLSAMERDVTIPEKFGVLHTVGDSCGPGGWSRFVRNFPVFLNLAQAIKRFAPSAVILNYTNPMTTLTGVLARELDNPVIGLCHGVYENFAFLAQQYGVEPQDIDAVYGGVNHFFWMTEVSIAGRDVIADLKSRLTGGRTLTDLEERASGTPFAPGAFHSAHELATELFQLTGVLPFLEDRHTSEFISWGVTDQDWMRAQRIVRTSMEDRQRNQSSWTADAKAAIERGLKRHELSSSGEGAAEVIAAHLTNRPHVDVGNVVNQGQISNLPLGLVVETAVLTDRRGFTPLDFGALPAVPASLTAPHAAAFEMLVDACYSGDLQAARRSLRLDPSVSHLPTSQVNDLADELITANGGFPTRP